MASQGAAASNTTQGSSRRQWVFIAKWRELCEGKEPKDFWAGLQSIFLVIAIIVGGAWTWITFGTLGSVNRARAELENLELQNARTRSQQSDIELNLEATQLKPPANDKNYYLTIFVTAKNIGTNNIVVCFEVPDKNLLTNCPIKEGPVSSGNQDLSRYRHYAPPITITRVKPRSDSTAIDFDAPTPADSWREDDPTRRLAGLDIRVGQTESLTALVPLKEVGLYRIGFAVRQPEDLTLVAPNLKSIWSITKFVVVKENSDL